ncbi:hypothetical protein IV203_030289 [Nitzschia inconspicua]|uniref:Uncharacterized protein n=1 Tax=Nitzschia inconspicua TaxID=303405 RepID=A0A9K3Q1M1_9STRA|nr:hypothetical protein IV203_030289 [Nitzschia inconspicua]
MSESVVGSRIRGWRHHLSLHSRKSWTRIIQHTNKYGERDAKDLTPINNNKKNAWTDFIAVIFVLLECQIQTNEQNGGGRIGFHPTSNPTLDSTVSKKIQGDATQHSLLRPRQTGGWKIALMILLKFKNSLEGVVVNVICIIPR